MQKLFPVTLEMQVLFYILSDVIWNILLKTTNKYFEWSTDKCV